MITVICHLNYYKIIIMVIIFYMERRQRVCSGERDPRLGEWERWRGDAVGVGRAHFC